jgi:hypothetical protein
MSAGEFAKSERYRPTDEGRKGETEDHGRSCQLDCGSSPK